MPISSIPTHVNFSLLASKDDIASHFSKEVLDDVILPNKENEVKLPSESYCQEANKDVSSSQSYNTILSSVLKKKSDGPIPVDPSKHNSCVSYSEKELAYRQYSTFIFDESCYLLEENAIQIDKILSDYPFGNLLPTIVDKNWKGCIIKYLIFSSHICMALNKHIFIFLKWIQLKDRLVIFSYYDKVCWTLLVTPRKFLLNTSFLIFKPTWSNREPLLWLKWRN